MPSVLIFFLQGTIPRILLPKEDKEKLKDVILCGPQRLADNMKEVFLLKNHLKRLHAGRLPLTVDGY